jgi:hypothetical protein
LAFSVDARYDLLLFLLIRINVGVKRLNHLIKRGIRTQRSTRRHLNSALGALFLPLTQVRSNAVLAKTM